MYFLDMVKILLRRWYIVVAGLLLIAGSAVVVIKIVPTEYQASGQLFLLLPTEATGVETPTNPFLNLQSGLTVTASLIAGSVSTQDNETALAAAGFTSEYSVALNPGTGPLLVITAADTDPARALATRNEVIGQLKTELERIQTEAQVPERQVIAAREFSVTAEAEVLAGSKIRALAGVGAVGLILTLLAVFSIERMGKRRRTRKLLAKRRQAKAAREAEATSDQAVTVSKSGHGIESSTGPADAELTDRAERVTGGSAR